MRLHEAARLSAAQCDLVWLKEAPAESTRMNAEQCGSARINNADQHEAARLHADQHRSARINTGLGRIGVELRGLSVDTGSTWISAA